MCRRTERHHDYALIGLPCRATVAAFYVLLTYSSFWGVVPGSSLSPYAPVSGSTLVFNKPHRGNLSDVANE